MAAVYKALSGSDIRKEENVSKNGVKRNRQKVLILSSRGVTYRQRHLLNDLYSLLPHSRKDVKLDSKSKLYQLNELAELYNTNSVVYGESRKGKDLYLWTACAPNGPTIKSHVQNLHTMEELNFIGNCLKGGKAVISFSQEFDKEPYLKLIKEVYLRIFGVPPTSRKIKPFIDRCMAFTWADGKVWVRNYQIVETEPSKSKPGEDGEETLKSKSKGKGAETELSLLEIGPRFVLTPIIIQEGSFGGPIIYSNKEFVSPNQVRRDIRLKKAARFNSRADQEIASRARQDELGLRTDGYQKPKDELDTNELFA